MMTMPPVKPSTPTEPTTPVAVATADELSYYATPGPLTRLPADSTFLAGLPTGAEELCRVSNQVIVHEFLADKYGVTGVADRLDELENRDVRDVIALIERLDPAHRPLAVGREPEHRMIGNCRHFTVLTCALLRRAGIPARARVGFGSYFDDSWVDHWILERWDAGQGRWLRSDPQLDDTLLKLFGIAFDPLDLPEGAFLTGSEAWQRCRRGEDDPERFGIMDMRGSWFIAGNVVRDLAALHKVELMPWDVWGAIDALPDDLVDEVAAAVVSGRREDAQRLYERAELRVPSVVRSHRFDRDVRVDLPA